jgi:sugar lactone lactonase YvrE
MITGYCLRSALVFCVAPLILAPVRAQTVSYSATTLVTFNGNGPNGVAVDSSGNVYVTVGNAVERVTSSSGGVVVAGSVTTSGSANGIGSAAGFNGPTGLATDSSGNIYVADTGNNAIREITPLGAVTTLAGLNQGDQDGVGIAAEFNQPTAVAVDHSGTVYVVDYGNNALRKVAADGTTTTLVLASSFIFDGVQTGGDASYYSIIGVAVDPFGNPCIGVDVSIPDGESGRYDVAVLRVAGVGSYLPQFIVKNVGNIFAYNSNGILAIDNNSNFYVIAGFSLYNGTTMISSQDLGTNFSGGRFGVAVDSMGRVYTSINSEYPTEARYQSVVVFTPVGNAPNISTQPSNVTIANGRSVAFNAITIGTSTPTYQWTFKGMPISGATDAVLLISGATSANAGTYACTASSSGGSVYTSTTLTVIPTSTPGYLANLSARANVSTGANILIAGFAIAGTGSMDLLLRGAGPSLLLAPFSLSNALPTTQLTLYDMVIPTNPQPIVTHSGWSNVLTSGTSTVNVDPIAATLALMNTLGAFTNNWAVGSADSALEVTPPAGGYTAQVSGLGGTSGIALAEIYDADAYTPATRLVNVSSRAEVGVGSNVLIGGFTIGGSTAETVLIRGVGPTLAGVPYSVTGALAQPVLTVYSGNIPIYSNTGWAGDLTIAGIFGTVGAFALNASGADSALLVTLPPGSYTAEVSGVSNSTGIGLVEIYELY